jgi:hypothetical protein
MYVYLCVHVSIGGRAVLVCWLIDSFDSPTHTTKNTHQQVPLLLRRAQGGGDRDRRDGAAQVGAHQGEERQGLYIYGDMCVYTPPPCLTSTKIHIMHCFLPPPKNRWRRSRGWRATHASSGCTRSAPSTTPATTRSVLLMYVFMYVCIMCTCSAPAAGSR